MRSTRKLAAVTAVAAAAMVFTGCAADGGDEQGAGELTFVTYGSAFQEAQESAMVDPFMAETGIDVTVESPVDIAKLKVMVETGNPTWDVYLADQQDAVGYCGEFFEPLDLSNINEDEFAPGTVSECGVPVDTYSYMLAYNTNTYGDNPPTSLADFFDTEAFPGVRSMSNFPAEGTLEMALLADGVSMEDMYPLDYDRAFSVLDQIKDGAIFWNAGAEQVELMESERADMILVWSGRGYEAVANGAPYKGVWASNSYHWASLAIVKGSPNKAAAQAFIDYAVSAGPQAAFAEAISYGPANLTAKPKLDEATAEWDSSRPENIAESWSIDNEWWADNTDEVLERWTEWTAG